MCVLLIIQGQFVKTVIFTEIIKIKKKQALKIYLKGYDPCDPNPCVNGTLCVADTNNDFEVFTCVKLSANLEGS